MEEYKLTQRDQEKIASNRSRLIVGNPREVYEQMETLRAVSNPDELLLFHSSVPLKKKTFSRITC